MKGVVVVRSLELDRVHGLVVLGKIELDILWLQNEFFVLLGLPWKEVLVVTGDHLGSVFLGLVLKVDALALATGTGTAETLSSIEIRKVLILTVQ